MLSQILLFVVFLAVVVVLALIASKMEGQEPRLKVKRLEPSARLPSRGNPYAAGLDIFLSHDAVVGPGQTQVLATGIAAEIPGGYFGMIRPRSSAFKRGLVIQGTVDSDYRGEVFTVVSNISNGPVILKAGTAIAQMILVPYSNLPVEDVKVLNDTVRGSRGFGSTGNTIF